jgi:hypothetical protein
VSPFVRQILALMALFASVAACSEPAVLPPPVAQVTVGAQGGTVQLSDGARVVIPPGALSGPVAIGVASTGWAGPVPPGVQRVGATYLLTPHGTQFGEPVALYLPFDVIAASGRAASVRLYMSGDGGTTWEPLPAVPSPLGGLAGGRTPHFSLALPGLPSDGSPIDAETGDTAISECDGCE